MSMLELSFTNQRGGSEKSMRHLRIWGSHEKNSNAGKMNYQQ
jgi:hypothetical protein